MSTYIKLQTLKKSNMNNPQTPKGFNMNNPERSSGYNNKTNYNPEGVEYKEYI